VSLRDFFKGQLTHQELINLIEQLPHGCALDRSQRGEAADWRIADHLLALIANVLLQANSSKQVPKSDLIQPPGARQEPRKVGGAKELDALFTGGG